MHKMIDEKTVQTLDHNSGNLMDTAAVLHENCYYYYVITLLVEQKYIANFIKQSRIQWKMEKK